MFFSIFTSLFILTLNPSLSSAQDNSGTYPVKTTNTTEELNQQTQWKCQWAAKFNIVNSGNQKSCYGVLKCTNPKVKAGSENKFSVKCFYDDNSSCDPIQCFRSDFLETSEYKFSGKKRAPKDAARALLTPAR